MITIVLHQFSILVIFIAIILGFIDAVTVNVDITKSPMEGKCTKGVIIVDTWHFCGGIGWNETYEKNFFGHETYMNYVPDWLYDLSIINIREQCSTSFMRLFCAILRPICVEVPNPMNRFETPKIKIVAPCRSLCKTVEKGCKDTFLENDKEWPFNCEDFPKASDVGWQCVPPVVNV
ncbi:frizzled-5-like isoform X2 [Convolutriloba macropyga]|uniref:frizzled-5-like isoform X2 n=1 Tax=Convolutriloba macropyga TaxID=536237 RepID=UPI003F523C15